MKYFGQNILRFFAQLSHFRELSPKKPIKYPYHKFQKRILARKFYHYGRGQREGSLGALTVPRRRIVHVVAGTRVRQETSGDTGMRLHDEDFELYDRKAASCALVLTRSRPQDSRSSLRLGIDGNRTLPWRLHDRSDRLRLRKSTG